MSISASILGDFRPGASKWSAICTSLFLQCLSLQELFSDSGYAVTASMLHHRLLHSRLFSIKRVFTRSRVRTTPSKAHRNKIACPGHSERGAFHLIFDTLWSH